MHRRTRPVAAFIAATALMTAGLPAAAQAAAPTSPQAKIGVHLERAQTAAKRVTRLTRGGDRAGATKALKQARREATAAARGARALAQDAGDSLPAAKTAIWSLTAAAGTYGAAMERFAGLIPATQGTALQSSLAGALPGTIAGREQLIAELTALVGELTGQARTIAAQALAALQAAAPAQVQQVAQVAGLQTLPTMISTLIQQALSTATMALQTGLSTLTAVAPELSAGTQTQITGALQAITGTMQQLLPLLQQVMGIATTSAAAGVQQATGIVQGLLGGLLGGWLGGGGTGGLPGLGGGTPLAGPSGGLLGGLISLPMGLPTGILGGLTGLLGGPAFGR
jgi:hypothetical protein